MNILITGAFGYVGGRIAQAIAQDGHRVVLASRHPRKPASVLLDLESPGQLQKICTSMDVVIHLAALNEIESAEDPRRAFMVNSLGTLNLLNAAMACGVKRFIYFSTAHVYGAPLAGTISEAATPRPVHPYAITHKAAEDWVLAAHDQRRIEGLVLRLSNAYGAPADPQVNRWTLIVNDLCRQAVTIQKMVLRSSGLQQRDFIAMADVARAVCHMLSLETKALGDGLFNLGGECAMPVIQLVQRIASRCEAVLGFRPEIVRPEPAPNEVSAPLCYHIEKLTSTGFRLTGKMDDEIDATLKLCHDCF